MKKNRILLVIFTLCNLQFIQAQVLRSMTPRYSNSSVKGNIVYVSNNIITSEGGVTGDVPPAGGQTNNGKMGLNIDVDNSTTLFSFNSSWKYLDNDSYPATWETSGFNDASWSSGLAQFGYGDPAVTTCVNSGGGGTKCTPTGTKYTTTLFRKSVTIANPAAFGDFELNVFRDDGIVVYVNGVEVVRDNMPGGTITKSTFASTACSDDGHGINTFTISTSNFVAGNNVIAVELHQCNATSSDLIFDMELIGNPPTSDLYFSFNSTWKYRDNNSYPGGWETKTFDDSGWPSGTGQFGYGDAGVTTCVQSGGGGTVCNPTGTKYITTLFRKNINITDASIYQDFTMNIYRDDGIVVYVNGVEVIRDNMPTGTITKTTLATTWAPDDGHTIQTFTIPTSAFTNGTNSIAVELHQSSNTSSDLVFDAQLIGNISTKTVLEAFGGSWKYLDNNTRPASWETVGFNDASWASGNGEFGYGDGDETTIVSYGPDPNNKYTTTYFRKTVSIPNVSLYGYYIINLKRDDGAVVYINGTEVFRTNMPAGTILHSTFANNALGGTAESTPVSFIIPAVYFVNGNNTIAVEMHQADLHSTDLSFDFELLGSNDPTFNSSSANLNLPSCSQVLFAGLYWGASQGENGTDVSWIQNENTVKLKIPGAGSYVDVVASQVDYHNNTLVPGLPHTGYVSFADITSLINVNAANGKYVIGNVASPANVLKNTCGGWTIVIAYSDPNTIVRNLTVFDGNVIMNGGDPPVHIPISGFTTPPSGPVSCDLGAVVFDGDRNSTDEYSFKEDSNPLVGSYTSLTPNATADLNDMWNSTITYKGATVLNRNPMQYNTLGYDADIIELPNSGNAILGNNKTSASIRFSSPSENYVLQVATTAISQYTPTFALSKSSADVNGGSLLPGDSILYTINYSNEGNDASTGTTIIDKIPVGTSYTPNSLMIGGVAKTDAAGDDEAEYDFANNRVIFRVGSGANSTNGGEVSPTGTGDVSFKVFTPSSCVLLTCNNNIQNRAKITYAGKLSLLGLYDSSGVDVSGCIVPNPVDDIISGSCQPLGDTILTNLCPATTVTIPVARYAGYDFYTGYPFSPANRYNPATPVSATHVYYAFYDGPGSCNDTIRISVFIVACPDIDDDDDGIPDYVEINNPVALQDANSNGIPNWNDPTYPGFVDNNGDGFNDNFDPSADSDNDKIPNFYDPDFPGYVDSNGDGVNDNMDKDLDGIPNHLDLDSDNDGIPDVVESFGVDANGDGKIDNYSDTDNDGFSQNVDGSSGGVASSGLGLGPLDTDGDGIPNYLDLDSDNDGIPDIIEAFGADVGNSAKVSSFVDSDGDGLTDALDGDVGNDAIAENSSNALLRTGTDVNNDGRTDSWPYKNMDGDSRPNAYDLDSDGDGITDVKEAGFTDANWDGKIDGAVNIDGRNVSVAAMPSLSFPNTDGTGRENIFDIDSDDDGIPDNVEGMSTVGYLLPTGLDSDGDGIDNAYDNYVGFGGDGVHVVDTDSDTVPDYLDSDADGDGLVDIIEGNDFNFNGQQDDNVTLTGNDTDGDGLDDRFDNDNASCKGTSAYMGNGGTTSGDASPGSITTVQHTTVTFGCPTERDWRCLPYVLSCEIVTFKAVAQDQLVRLDWAAICRQEVDHFIVERSTDHINFSQAVITPGRPVLNEIENYYAFDNITGNTATVIYYRLTTVLKSGKTLLSSVIAVKRSTSDIVSMKVMPNPVKDQLQLLVNVPNSGTADIAIFDETGRMVHHSKEKLQKGSNTIVYAMAKRIQAGMYYVRLQMEGILLTERFHKLD
ncbi:MAG: T9SS type A sorting domain-containing protein [Chitinophagaceae bacterium]